MAVFEVSFDLCTGLFFTSYVLIGKKTIVDYNVISPLTKSGMCMHTSFYNDLQYTLVEISVLTLPLVNIPCSPGTPTSQVQWRTISHFV